jgi:peptide/nickel transport system permease protein
MLMAGAFNSLSISALSVLVGMTIGTALGVAAAARRGLFEAVIMRICDAMFAFPPILSAIMVGALLGPGALTAVLAIGAFMVPVFARVTRGAALQIWAREYVLAARMAGRSGLSITAAHVIPNIASHIIIQVAIQLALAILTEAGLSFLGLGVPPPTASWTRRPTCSSRRGWRWRRGLRLLSACLASTCSATACATCSTRGVG